MNTKLERLTAKVAAVNKANVYAAKLYPELVKIFEPLVGEKILKVDGTLLSKYAALLPEFPCNPHLHVYRNSSDYSLAWTVKSCEMMPPHSCMYHEVVVYVGEIRGQHLVKMMDHPFNGRTDFTVEEILGKREAYISAKKVMEELRSELYPFGDD